MGGHMWFSCLSCTLTALQSFLDTSGMPHNRQRLLP